MQNYGIALKEQRELKGISQLELYQKINTSHQNINRWENNKVLPSIDFCVQLADYYNISLDELIGRDTFDGAVVITKYVKSEIAEIYEKLNRQNQMMALGYLTALLQKQNQA